jgi:hypothetical protein
MSSPCFAQAGYEAGVVELWLPRYCGWWWEWSHGVMEWWINGLMRPADALLWRGVDA